MSKNKKGYPASANANRARAASPVPVTQAAKKSSSYEIYRKINWAKLSDEFLTSTNPDGTLTYTTAWSFAKAKCTTPQERDVIYWCIGPKPIPSLANGTDPSEHKKKKATVPWLGDWQLKRSHTFYFSDKMMAKADKALGEKLDAETAAAAGAQIALQGLARFNKYAEQVDAEFSHMAVIPGAPMQDNKDRVHMLMSMQARIWKQLSLALGQYLECHGVGRDNTSVLAQLTMASALATLRGAAAGEISEADVNADPTVRLIAQTMYRKSQTFKMPLPELDAALEPPARRTVDVAASRGNGGTKGNGKGGNGSKTNGH